VHAVTGESRPDRSVCPRDMTLLRGRARPARLERVAPLAVTDIETISDDREHHRVCAEQELPVFDGLVIHVRLHLRSAVAVPAKFVANFRLQGERTGHCRQYTATSIGGKDKSALELTA
jgi:hypothetical protein